MSFFRKINNFTKERYKLLKADKTLLYIIFFLHLLAVFAHMSYSFHTETPMQCYVRSAFCITCAIFTFLFHRKGFAVILILYGYALLFLNNFYNYTSVLFLIIGTNIYPQIKNKAYLVYILCVCTAFSHRHLILEAFEIHSIYFIFFFIVARDILAPKITKDILLTDDERKILTEMTKGKLQKEITLFSQNTITSKLKNARDRNFCKSTAELLAKFSSQSDTTIDNTENHNADCE